jgi:hypothetical protein
LMGLRRWALMLPAKDARGRALYSESADGP